MMRLLLSLPIAATLACTAPPSDALATRSPPVATSPSNPAGISWVKSQGVVIAKTETTAAQYGLCVATGTCSAPLKLIDTDNWQSGREDHPINEVNWQQAVTFCTWARARLPTAAEWDRVASNGGVNAYPWGDTEPDGTRANVCDRNCDADGGKNNDIDDGFAHTSPACSYPAGRNKDGICDLAGNVVEWTATDRDETTKETRGGSWNLTISFARNAKHDNDSADKQSHRIGFRCVQ